MHSPTKTAAMLLLGVAILGGCATKGQLRKAVSDQQAALATERNERMAADQQLTTNVTQLQTDMTQLRADLDSMRTEFGAKIAAVEEGIRFDMPVHFAYDDATVRPEDTAALDRFSKVVSKYYPGVTVTVEGFADPAGAASYNKKLSARRADAVGAYLTQQGIQAQLRTVGYGETRQVVPHAYKDQPGAELNRRVVFVIESPQAAAQMTALDGSDR